MAIGVDIDRTRRSIYSDARRRYNDLSLSQLNIIAFPIGSPRAAAACSRKVDALRGTSKFGGARILCSAPCKITARSAVAVTYPFPPSFEIEEGLALLLTVSADIEKIRAGVEDQSLRFALCLMAEIQQRQATGGCTSSLRSSNVRFE